MADWTSIQSPTLVGVTAPQDPELVPAANTTATTPGLINGPPYLPNTALVGGVPTVSIDDPISAVLMFLFFVSAASHMAVFQINKRRDHVFVFSAMMFAFSMIRALALVLRIAWASHQTNVRLSIAANILTQAGTVIVFIINLFFAQRILRGYHPNFGWSTPARVLFRFLVASVVISLLMVIATTVQSFFTLDEEIRARDRQVQLFGGTYLTVLAFLPVPIVVLSAVTPRKYVIEKFGTGSWRAKLFLVLFTSTIMTMGAGFRVGTNYAPRPMNDPAWYHGRGPYYGFNYILDVTVAYLYLTTGFHKRFFVPAGAKGPGSYLGSLPTEKLHPLSHRRASYRRASRLTPPGSFQSNDTFATQFGAAPSPTIHSSKFPIGYVGYNNSASSLKNSQQAQRKKQCNYLAKFNSPQFQHSTASLDSQGTYVGSMAPSIADTVPSIPSLYRGVTGGWGGHIDLPMGAGDPLRILGRPLVPMMPAVAMDNMSGTSREGTIYEELEDAIPSASDVEPNAGAMFEGTHQRKSSDVLSDMLDKMEKVRKSVDSIQRSHHRASAERARERLRMVESQHLQMSGAGGAQEGERNGRAPNSPNSPSSPSSHYTDNLDGFDGAENTEGRPRQNK